jgi:hypothetical protein
MREPHVTRPTDELASYEVRSTKQGRSRGIYLRNYNVKLATFASNSQALQTALTKLFDSAHERVEAAKRHASSVDPY